MKRFDRWFMAVTLLVALVVYAATGGNLIELATRGLMGLGIGLFGIHISLKNPFGKHSVFHQAAGVAKKLAPAAVLIPGVGPVLAGAIGAGASLAHGDKLGEAVKSGVVGGVGGYGLSKLAGGAGLSGLKTSLLGTGAKGAAGAAAKSGILGKAWDYIGKNPLKAAQYGSAALSTIQGARRQGQSDKLLNNAVGRLNAPRSPIDLSSMFADPNDPYRSGGGPNRAAASARASLSGGY